jgi:nondiscriminating aspartyl-tRNA synthetase
LIKSTEDLPFALDDVNQLYLENDRNNVLLNTRLNNRPFDLRVPFNNCIFKNQSSVCRYFREFLYEQDFIEIHSPKTIGTPSEGGAAVFELKYFNSPAFLAQSPQLYKQMCINADFNKVFEIGPVFRAENCISHRHLCEFTGLDIEMALTPGETYYEIIEIFWSTLVNVFKKLNGNNKKELYYIKSYHKFDDLKFSEEPFILEFKEGVKMLQESGNDQSMDDDLSSVNEKKLGDLVKEKFGYDIFVLDKYPSKVRPFYTMPSGDLYSNSYDVIMRGQEISSGSQRQHDYEKLLSALKERDMNPLLLKDYLDSFKYGSRPHGGCGFGLERIVMLYLDLENVRETSLFPRDPARVTP